MGAQHAIDEATKALSYYVYCGCDRANQDPLRLIVGMNPRPEQVVDDVNSALSAYADDPPAMRLFIALVGYAGEVLRGEDE